MERKQSINYAILIIIFSLLACDSRDMIAAFSSTIPTPTFEVARFRTATLTSTPTETPEATPPEPATPTPVPTETLQPSAADVPIESAADGSDAASNVEPATPEVTPTPEATATPTTPPEPPPPTATETPVPTPAPLAGRIAFPIDDGAGHYDVWVFEVPDGEPFIVQPRARQPVFSKDGQLLVNLHDSDRGEHIAWLDANFTWKGEVSDSPYDSHPFWQPDSRRYVFSNPQFLKNPQTGAPLPYVFMPCSMERPFQEQDVRCRDIGTGGKVAPGEYPVWTDDDRIAFFSFEGEDGIYVVNAASGLWESGGVGAPQLLVASNGLPTDTQGFQVFFHAGNIDQNWEAYMIDLDGSNLTNLSNSPTSFDGLPTVSPDGNWVAFVSDRDGKWGIWVVPRTGGEPEKLLDFSKINTNPSPWGTGDRDWTFERISWGP